MKNQTPEINWLTRRTFDGQYAFVGHVTLNPKSMFSDFKVEQPVGHLFPTREAADRERIRVDKFLKAPRQISEGRAFFFHYNKPASLKAGKPILTVHQSGVCHLVEGVTCNVPVQTRIRTTQPRCVMAGKGTVTIQNNSAIIS